MERQTNLTLDEILSKLELVRNSSGCGGCHRGSSEEPPCLLVNELGVLAADEGKKEAEAKLREMLDWPEEALRAIAYLCLTRVPRPDSETAGAMLAFAQRPENADVLDWADEEQNKRN